MSNLIDLWIDAADFQNKGEWKLDTQFVHLMGSPYLLACHEPGTPVADAVTSVTIPVAGKYRFWARTKNWLHPHNPGLFHLKINGINSVLGLGGLPTHDWYWQCAGDFDLPEGVTNIALCDETGYFGRLAALLITSDMDSVPPRPVEDYIRERARIKNIRLEPKPLGDFDLVIAGGGPAGVPAAIIAARRGLKTLLINNRPVLGGNASSEAGIAFNGASARQPHAREGGIVEEIIRHHARNIDDWKAQPDKDDVNKPSWTLVLEMLCRNEKNLTLLMNHHVCAAETKENHIRNCIAFNTLDGTRVSVNGKYFMDCTGDGWLGYFAGAKYRLGREPKWLHNEDFAPDQYDNCTMSGCLLGNRRRFEDTGKPVAFDAPDWVPRYNPKAFGRHIENFYFPWWLEAPNVLDDLFDAEAARDELFRIILGYYHFLKNLWDKKESFVNYKLKFMPHFDAKRESRRFVGDYILTQNDCVAGKDFEDKISHTGWPIDLHHPKGIFSGSEGPFFSNTHVPLVKVPFRCLYSKNITNLLFAGRCASVSHVALGTARIQGTIAAMAQAAATAVSLCIQKNVTPRELGLSHIRELQQVLLKDDQYILDIKNSDTRDLALHAKVTASSYSIQEIFEWHLGKETHFLPLDQERAVFFARTEKSEINAIWAKFLNETDSPIEVRLDLFDQQDPDGYDIRRKPIASPKAVVPPRCKQWIKFNSQVKVELRYLWAKVDRTPGLSWGVVSMPPLDWTRSERKKPDDDFPNIRWEAHSISLIEPGETQANCAPSNVVNGYGRIRDKENYAWVSDPEKPMPQWIELSLGRIEKINTLCLTFDTDMNNPSMLEPLKGNPEVLVSDYSIELFQSGTWRTIVQEADNFQRRRIHRFPGQQAEKVRITVTKTHGDKSARVFEVRLYNEN